MTQLVLLVNLAGHGRIGEIIEDPENAAKLVSNGWAVPVGDLPDAPEDTSAPTDMAEMSAKALVAHIGEDEALAREALALELARDTPRSTVMGHIEALLEPDIQAG